MYIIIFQDDEKEKSSPLDETQRKEEILSMTKQLDPKYSKIAFGAFIKLRLDSKEIESVKRQYIYHH